MQRYEKYIYYKNMKKFSTIAHVKVGTEPVVTLKKEEVANNDIKCAIDYMIDQHLKIGYYGPYTTEFFQQTSKIEGREMFIESLILLLKEKEIQQQIKILESLKSTTKDWQAIDEKIDSLLLEKQTPAETLKHKRRVLDLLDKEDPEKMAELQANKIKTGEKAFYRGQIAKSLKSEKPESAKMLDKIASIFLFKAKQLGYQY